MEEDFKKIFQLSENNVLLALQLPENKNFIEKTKIFQNEIKSLDKKLELNERLIKNIYFISSELIQAVIHDGIFQNDLFTNCVKLSYTDNRFYLLSQNLIEIQNIPRIEKKFDEVNSAFDAEDSTEELQLRYKYKIKNTPMTKSGISVGVLDLARRSLNKLHFNFENINDTYAIFSIICTIDVD